MICEEQILHYITLQERHVPNGYLKEYFQKKFINHKIAKANKIDKISLQNLEQLYEETNEPYLMTLIAYRKANDRRSRFQRLQVAMDGETYIQPSFKINSVDSIYTAKPSVVFSIQELEQMLKAKSFYCETLEQALEFVSTTPHRLIAVIKTTVYYKEKDSMKERSNQVKNTVHKFEEMMDRLRESSRKEFGFLRIDFDNMKILEKRIDVEALFEEVKYKYYLTKIMQTALQSNMKIIRHHIMKYGEVISGMFVVLIGNEQYIVRMILCKNRDVQIEVKKNIQFNEKVEDILRYPASQAFSSEYKLRKAYTKFYELNRLASNGDEEALQLVITLFAEVIELEISSIDALRLYTRLIQGYSPSHVLDLERKKNTVSSKLYENIQYSEVYPRKSDVRQLEEGIKKNQKWIQENKWVQSDGVKKTLDRMDAENKEMKVKITQIELR